MVIIRRNEDGSIIEEQNTTTQSHPALATRQGMEAMSDSGRVVPTLFSEIATKINNAKDKPKKLKVKRTRFSTFKTGFKGCISSRYRMVIAARRCAIRSK